MSRMTVNVVTTRNGLSRAAAAIAGTAAALTHISRTVQTSDFMVVFKCDLQSGPRLPDPHRGGTIKAEPSHPGGGASCE